MKKRLLSLILCLILILITVYADTIGENKILNGSFEDDDLPWEGVIRSKVEYYSGEFSAKIMNPIGPSVEKGVPHTAEYNPYFYLEEGNLYHISLYIKSTTDDFSQPPDANLYYSEATNRIVFNIGRTSSQWQYISGLFVADRTGDHSFSMILYGQSENSEFYVDDISLIKTSYKPSSISIQGRKNVYIPDLGTKNYAYRTITTDNKGNEIPILTSKIHVLGDLPHGISFSEEDAVLTVSSETALSSIVTLICDPPVPGMRRNTLNIIADKNLIENGSFENEPFFSGWDKSSSNFDILTDSFGKKYAEVFTEKLDDNLYVGSLNIDNPIALKDGVLYVLRAKVRSLPGFDTRQVLSNVVSDGAYISINISNIGGGEDYFDVFAAIRPYAEGVYQISINFLSPDERPIYVDDIRLLEEEPAPADIIFNAPAHISKPEIGNVIIPFDYAIRDQEGNILPSDSISASISPSEVGIVVEGKSIVVSSNAKEKSYKVTAIYNHDLNVKGSHTFSVTSETVGDGSFEHQSPGQWWVTGEPSKLNIVSTHSGYYPADGEKMARLTMNDSVSMLVSDSYKKYEKGKSYVFEASFIKVVPDIETIVTVLIDNAFSDSFDDNLILNQFEIKEENKDTKIVFMPNETITGRLMIAFNTPEVHDSQVVLIDCISMPNAYSEANNVYISGFPYVDRNITGRYRFSANFDTADASTFRWLMSSTADGVYMPIVGQTSQTLSIIPDMVDMYIKFEVTPISLLGAVSGRSVSSEPVKIGVYTGSSPIEEIPEATPPPDDEKDDENSDNVKPKGELQVININNIHNSTTNFFVDMQNHWAREDVNLMAAAKIVNGRGNGLFAPSEIITRAEFSAFLIRAFGLAPTYYNDRFQDVNSWDWYSGVVETVLKYGIAQGTGENNFSPNMPLTREQMVSMLMRAYKKTGAPMQDNPNFNYLDNYNISSWAVWDVGAATNLGIITGTLENKFEPKRNATRAEAIVAIKRMINSALNSL